MAESKYQNETKAWLAECEAGIRAGRVPEVRERLLELNGAQLADDQRLPFANLCRRVGLNELGLRLLSPLVEESRRPRGTPLNEASLAEYAVLLQRIGALEEASKILSQLDAAKTPEVSLFQAFCHFNRW